MSFCVIPSDKDLYLESGNDTFIIYNRDGGRETDRERANSSLKQQHAAGRNTTSSEQACPIEDQLLHFEERERERKRKRKIPFVQIKGTFSSTEIWKEAMFFLCPSVFGCIIYLCHTANCRVVREIQVWSRYCFIYMFKTLHILPR